MHQHFFDEHGIELRRRDREIRAPQQFKTQAISASGAREIIHPQFAQEGRRFRAMAWRAAERADFLEQNRDGMNLAFSLDKNEFQGETYLELSVADFKELSDSSRDVAPMATAGVERTASLPAE